MDYFDAFFDINSIDTIYQLLQKHDFTSAKNEINNIYVNHRKFFTQLSNKTSALFGPIESHYIGKKHVAVVVDDLISSEDIYLDFVTKILDLVKEIFLKDENEMEDLQILTISGKFFSFSMEEIRMQLMEQQGQQDVDNLKISDYSFDIIDRIKTTLLGSFDKKNKYWTDNINSSIYQVIKYLANNFDELNMNSSQSSILILQNSVDAAELEVEKMLTFLYQWEESKLDSDESRSEIAITERKRLLPYIFYVSHCQFSSPL